MQRLKSNSAKTLMPLLTPDEASQLQRAQSVTRSFWKASFRGIMIQSEEAFWDCIRYVHLNPVKAELCERIADFRWSSGWMFEAC